MYNVQCAWNCAAFITKNKTRRSITPDGIINTITKST